MPLLYLRITNVELRGTIRINIPNNKFNYRGNLTTNDANFRYNVNINYKRKILTSSKIK